MSFFGLFGHDANPPANDNPIVRLPQAPPVSAMQEIMTPRPGYATTGIVGSENAADTSDYPAPSAPSGNRPITLDAHHGAFDRDHRQQTLLALSSAFGGARNFGEGLANAAKAIYGQNEAVRKEYAPTLTGPNGAFEARKDPTTGEITYTPVQPMIDYLRDKTVRPKDQADLNGRVMYGILQLPEEDRADAYREVIQNPERYGVDPRNMPQDYNPLYARLSANGGMTVSQAQTREQAKTNSLAAQYDRERRTGIYKARSEATTRQGDERLGLSREGLAVRKATAARSGRGKPSKPPSVSMRSSADLHKMLGF